MFWSILNMERWICEWEPWQQSNLSSHQYLHNVLSAIYEFRTISADYALNHLSNLTSLLLLRLFVIVIGNVIFVQVFHSVVHREAFRWLSETNFPFICRKLRRLFFTWHVYLTFLTCLLITVFKTVTFDVFLSKFWSPLRFALVALAVCNSCFMSWMSNSRVNPTWSIRLGWHLLFNKNNNQRR